MVTSVGAADSAEIARSREGREKRYAELCTSIRTTDDISFKLLGFVPLVSSAGIVGAGAAGTLVENSAWSPAVIFVSLLGALLTFGVYRWELRNIQTSRWLQKRAAAMEKYEFGLSKGQFAGRGPAPEFLGIRMGKTEAETIVYATAIAGWLALPVVVAAVHWLS